MNSKDQMSVIHRPSIEATIINLSVNPKSDEGGRKKNILKIELILEKLMRATK